LISDLDRNHMPISKPPGGLDHGATTSSIRTRAANRASPIFAWPILKRTMPERRRHPARPRGRGFFPASPMRCSVLDQTRMRNADRAVGGEPADSKPSMLQGHLETTRVLPLPRASAGRYRRGESFRLPHGLPGISKRTLMMLGKNPRFGIVRGRVPVDFVGPCVRRRRNQYTRVRPWCESLVVWLWPALRLKRAPTAAQNRLYYSAIASSVRSRVVAGLLGQLHVATADGA